ncbi:MAG: glycosyl hydrolase family 28-related protein [Verrucomicrobiota bacterium]
MKNNFILPALFLLAMLFCGQTQAQEKTPESNNLLVANVREFGAKGDGKTDDTAAIEKAWRTVCKGQKPGYRGKGPSPRGYAAVNEPALYFPPGVYVYKGKGLECPDAQVWHIKGDGPNQARIELSGEVYFLTCGRVESTIFEGLSLVGGKGAFRSIWTKNMVGGRHIFRDCYFIDYSECAIGNNADDSPYLSVEDCIFYGRAKSPSIGIAWGGYFDDSQITRCAFEQNKYHLKLGDRLSGSLQVGPRNSFISFGGTKKEADIWLVPNSDAKSWGVNSGQGILISDNKFGNENRDTDKPRILIALEDKASGSDRLARQHSTTVVPGQGSYVTGVKLRDNLLSGSGGEQRGIVYSYIAQAGISFDHNYHYGTPYPYLIEFDPGIKRLQDHTPGNTSYVYSQERDNKQWGPLGPAVSNLPGYAIPFDPDLFLAGSPEAPAVWQRGDDPGYQPIASLTGRDMLASGAGQLKAVADAHGGETAAEFTAAAKNAGLTVRLDDTKQLQEGRVGFIEVELKRSDAAPLDTVYLWLVHNYGQSNERVSARTVRLQANWQRITLPFVIRNLDGGRFHLVLLAEQFQKGEQERFVCGNVRVYHATAPHSGVREGLRSIGDQDAAIMLGRDPEQIHFAAALTADRTLTFATPHASIQPLPGTRFHLSRSGTGPGILKVVGIATLTGGEWCEVTHDGTAYRLTAKGSLK